MKFGIHDTSWLDTSNPAEAFEVVKTKAQWAEKRSFAWRLADQCGRPNDVETRELFASRTMPHFA